MAPKFHCNLPSFFSFVYVFKHTCIVSNAFLTFLYLFCHCLQLLSEGLNQKIVGSLMGDIKLSLVTDEGSYDITGDTGTANIGGKKQLFHSIT